MKEMKVVRTYTNSYGMVVEELALPADWSLEDEVEFQEMKARSEA